MRKRIKAMQEELYRRYMYVQYILQFLRKKRTGRRYITCDNLWANEENVLCVSL